MSDARLFTHPAMARKRFRDLVDRRDEEIGLTETALVIALEEYPGLDVSAYLDRIETWAAAVRQRARSAEAERILEHLNRLLFEEEGFRGETGDYYDPRSAFMNEVLDRHAGLPLALSIVYLELSRRVGLPATGISIAGRVLVRVIGPLGDLLIDPWDDGRVLSPQEVQEILDQVYGGGVRLREDHLRGLENREIVARALAHLKSIYLTHHDLERAIGAIDRILILDASDPYEVRDRGLLAMQVHRYEEALEFLGRYLERAPFADDARQVRENMEYLRQWLGQN